MAKTYTADIQLLMKAWAAGVSEDYYAPLWDAWPVAGSLDERGNLKDDSVTGDAIVSVPGDKVIGGDLTSQDYDWGSGTQINLDTGDINSVYQVTVSGAWAQTTAKTAFFSAEIYWLKSVAVGANVFFALSDPASSKGRYGVVNSAGAVVKAVTVFENTFAYNVAVQIINGNVLLTWEDNSMSAYFWAYYDSTGEAVVPAAGLDTLFDTYVAALYNNPDHANFLCQLSGGNIAFLTVEEFESGPGPNYTDTLYFYLYTNAGVLVKDKTTIYAAAEDLDLGCYGAVGSDGNTLLVFYSDSSGMGMYSGDAMIEISATGAVVTAQFDLGFFVYNNSSEGEIYRLGNGNIFAVETGGGSQNGFTVFTDAGVYVNQDVVDTLYPGGSVNWDVTATGFAALYAGSVNPYYPRLKIYNNDSTVLIDIGAIETDAFGKYLALSTFSDGKLWCGYKEGGEAPFNPAGGTKYGTFIIYGYTAGGSVTFPGLTYNALLGYLGLGTDTPGALLDLGAEGETMGSMRLAGSTSGHVTITAQAVAGHSDVVIVLPNYSGTFAISGTAPISVDAVTGDITHSTSAGYKHILTGGTVGQIARNTASGTQGWGTVRESSGAFTYITTISMSGALTNTLATGNAPLAVSSTTRCANLNADLLDGVEASAFVTKATYTAYTILAATTTATPAALTVTEATLVGRLTGGAIAALSVADVQTLLSIPSSADFVTKTAYDAYSILMATTDDTPVAITIAEQTLVGRITGGTIKALSVAEAQTLLSVPSSADFVTKTAYDAYLILMATTDDTPIALTVTEQTLVGRITGGAIAALSTTQVRTLINVEDGAEVNNISDVNATDLTDGGATTLHSHAWPDYWDRTGTVLSPKTAGDSIVASDHGTAATAQVINVAYGTGAAPAANTTPEGSIYITYTV